LLAVILFYFLTVHRIIYTRALKPQHIKILKAMKMPTMELYRVIASWEVNTILFLIEEEIITKML